MPQRLAAALSLVVFAMCVLIGGFHAENTFGTAVGRAVLAMGVTFIIALIVGHMAQRMLEENLKQLKELKERKNAENFEAKSPPTDR
jgi:Na+(H+)/acetate symporter ActP